MGTGGGKGASSPEWFLAVNRRGAVFPHPRSSQPMKDRRRGVPNQWKPAACGGIATGNIDGDLAQRFLLGAAFPEAQDRCVSRTKIPGASSLIQPFGLERLLFVRHTPWPVEGAKEEREEGRGTETRFQS